MKKIIAPVAVIFLFGASCQTVQDNVDARKNLAKCTYEFDRIELRKVEIGGVRLQTMDFNVFVKITNNSPTDVALDKVEGDIFLDEHKTINISHKKFLRIKPGESASEPIVLHIPFASALKTIGHRPENLTVAVKIYMTLMLKEKHITSPYPLDVEKTFPIPWDQINAEIKKQSGQIEEKKAEVQEKAKDKISDQTEAAKKKVKFKKPF